jgi:hypothetical protein
MKHLKNRDDLKSILLKTVRAGIIIILTAMISFSNTACGGGGGGGGTVVNPVNNTEAAVKLNTGLSALNGATPDYATAKSQLSQVITAPDATTEQKMTAYSALGWANIKSSAGVSDIDQAISSFSEAINSQSQQGQISTAVNQAYVGRSVSQIIKDSAAFTSAINDLNSAGFSNLETQYLEDAIKTGVTTPQIRGYKAFLHLIRNESADTQLFNDNYNKLKSVAASDKNALLMINALDMMLKEN